MNHSDVIFVTSKMKRILFWNDASRGNVHEQVILNQIQK